MNPVSVSPPLSLSISPCVCAFSIQQYFPKWQKLTSKNKCRISHSLLFYSYYSLMAIVAITFVHVYNAHKLTGWLLGFVCALTFEEKKWNVSERARA